MRSEVPINCNQIMKWSAFLLFATSVFLPHSQWAKTDEKLNVILIICDDLNDYVEGGKP